MENKDYKELYEEQLQLYFMKCIENVVAYVLAFLLLLSCCLDVFSAGVTIWGIVSLIGLLLCFCLLKDTVIEVYEYWKENEVILKRRKK